MIKLQLVLPLLLSVAIHLSHGFFASHPCTLTSHCKQNAASSLYAKRYGPPPDSNIDFNDATTNDDNSSMKEQFISIIGQVMSAKEEDIPSLITKNIGAIMSAMSVRDLLEEILQEQIETNSNNVEEFSDAVDTIVTYAESFVEETVAIENAYKELLGKIFKLITPAKNNQIEKEDTLEIDSSTLESELDQVLSNEKEAFSPGFLRHLEGECERIANSPNITPESTKMLQIMRVIQTRVLEELGKGIGEGAIMLGQLLGYDDKAERLAVLDAGLTVRGVEFACELSALTGEALQDFKSITDVDPELVKSIKEIDERIGLFMEKNQFQ